MIAKNTIMKKCITIMRRKRPRVLKPTTKKLHLLTPQKAKRVRKLKVVLKVPRNIALVDPEVVAVATEVKAEMASEEKATEATEVASEVAEVETSESTTKMKTVSPLSRKRRLKASEVQEAAEVAVVAEVIAAAEAVVVEPKTLDQELKVTVTEVSETRVRSERTKNLTLNLPQPPNSNEFNR